MDTVKLIPLTYALDKLILDESVSTTDEIKEVRPELCAGGEAVLGAGQCCPTAGILLTGCPVAFRPCPGL